MVMNLFCKPIIWKMGKKQETAYKLEKQIVKAMSLEGKATNFLLSLFIGGFPYHETSVKNPTVRG
jgi:hypothetical protein